MSADDSSVECEGKSDCAPTAMLLMCIVHSMYGKIGQSPKYFGNETDEDFQYMYRTNFGADENESEKLFRRQTETDPTEEYDFIVVGGGTAGSVVASRLSENEHWKVLLLEAGPEQPKLTLIPALTMEFRGSNIDWKYTMRPKKGFCENRRSAGCEVVAGRTLGGTSSINDMAYMRGNAADYDEWAAAGNEGWSFKKVLRYFKYSEGNNDKDMVKNTYHHSKDGPLDVGKYGYMDKNVDILSSGLRELGYNETDINGAHQLGYARVQSMTYSGERVSTYTAFIEPIRNSRSNLNIETEALVTKLILKYNAKNDVTRINGVEYIKGGEIRRVNFKKEVILSAGAINSPKLLMQSGIGPREYLEYLDLKVFVELPVGNNFHDHVSVCLPIIKLPNVTKANQFPEKLKHISRYFNTGAGPLSANFQLVAYYKIKNNGYRGAPDIEIRFRGHNSNLYYNNLDICISLLTPKSRGQVVLNASQPIFGNPLIYPNFLKDETDEIILLEGIEEAIKIFDTKALRRAGFEFDPLPILDNECGEKGRVTDEFWSCVIRHFSTPLHNYVGSCKMGASKDPDAVVDSQLRVHGVQKLRIADASIIPTIPRGSTAAPVIMIAEKASDLIKATWI